MLGVLKVQMDVTLCGLLDKEPPSSFVVAFCGAPTNHASRNSIFTPENLQTRTLRLHCLATAPLQCALPLPTAAGHSPSYDKPFNHVAGAFFSSIGSSNENGRREHVAIEPVDQDTHKALLVLVA